MCGKTGDSPTEGEPSQVEAGLSTPQRQSIFDSDFARSQQRLGRGGEVVWHVVEPEEAGQWIVEAL